MEVTAPAVPSEESALFSRKSKWLVAVVLSAALLYLALTIHSGWSSLSSSFRMFPKEGAAGILVLVAAGLLVRFLRWQFYLARLGENVPWGGSLLIFLASFSLTATPAKAGELIKGVFLKQRFGVPVTKTAGILLAERLTDLLAMLVLASSVFLESRREFRLYWVCLAAVLSLMVFLSVPRFYEFFLRRLVGVLPALEKILSKVQDLLDRARALLPFSILSTGLGLSLAAWFCECLAFWWVLKGFALPISLGQATFIYALSTIIGALSFLPGGVGSMEACLLLLLGMQGVDKTASVPAVLIIRFSTLWFVTALGLVFAWALHLRPIQRVAFGGSPE